MTGSEKVPALAAVGTEGKAHVLDDPHEGHLHHFRHVHHLFDNPGREVLGRAHHDNPVKGYCLHYRKRCIGGTRRQVDDQYLGVLPVRVVPELAYDVPYERAAPNDGFRGVLHEEVHGHDLDPQLRCCGRDYSFGGAVGHT